MTRDEYSLVVITKGKKRKKRIPLSKISVLFRGRSGNHVPVPLQLLQLPRLIEKIGLTTPR
jgi:hypothetical protein